MPFVRKMDDSTPVQESTCIHLRSKAMYVTGLVRVPDRADEPTSGHCWCNLTQHVIGPDRTDVTPELCIPGRDCFREVYDV